MHIHLLHLCPVALISHDACVMWNYVSRLFSITETGCGELTSATVFVFQGEMCATPDIFAHLAHLLMNLAGGKLCAVLEVGLSLSGCIYFLVYICYFFNT